MTLGNRNCPDCHGAGFRDGPPREIGTSDGRKVKYPTVEPCPCRAPSTAIGTPPPTPPRDNQQKAAGDQG